MRKIMRVISSILCVSTLTTMLSISTFAATNNAVSNTSKEVLGKYLSALQKQDIKSAVMLSVDKRCSGDVNEEFSLKEILSDPNQQVRGYKILDTEFQKEGYKIHLANVTFSNDKVCQIPFKLDNTTGTWQVIISSELVDSSLYKTINEGKEIINNEKTDNNSIVSPLLSSYLARWYSLHLGGTEYSDIYYTSSFNIANSYVTINFQQSNGMPSQRAEVNYAIVTKGTFSDTVWGSLTKTGNVTSSTWETITCGSRSGVKLRLTNIYHSSLNTAGEDVFGEVYDGTP